MEVARDEDAVIERVAALDIGKAELVCCVRLPGPGKRRLQEVRTFSTMTRSLLVMADWLTELGVKRVVMEATSDYWKPPFYLLEGSFQTWLVNAKDVKHLPGRPKTDRLDAAWLCKVAEREMLRPSFVPPPPIRVVRDLTRYRVDLIVARTAEKQRVEKLLEDALIKVSVVASDIFGVSGRDMMAALIARGTRPGPARGPGPRVDAGQERRAAGGVHRPVHRAPRVLADQDARTHRPAHRGHRPGRGPHPGADRPFRSSGGPTR